MNHLVLYQRVLRLRDPQAPTDIDPLAHQVEHSPFKAGVPRSSRGWVTSFSGKPLKENTETVEDDQVLWYDGAVAADVKGGWRNW